MSFFLLILVSKKKIAFGLFLMLAFLFLFKYAYQPERPEIEEDCIHHLISGYLAVDNMNRMTILASENNPEFNFHDTLAEQSTRMKNIINRLNNTNNLILENITRWLLSNEKVSIEEIIQESVEFQNFSANITQFLATIYSIEQANKTIENDLHRLSEQLDSQIEKVRLASNRVQMGKKHCEQTVHSYNNYKITKDMADQAARNLSDAQQQHHNAKKYLLEMNSKNITLVIQKITREKKLSLISRINEEISKLNKNWADFHVFLSKFSNFIQSTSKVCCFIFSEFECRKKTKPFLFLGFESTN